MSEEEKQATIIAIPPEMRSGHHSYSVFSHYAKEAVEVTAQGLLEIAAWVEEHRAELLQQAEGAREKPVHRKEASSERPTPGPHSPESPNYGAFDDDL